MKTREILLGVAASALITFSAYAQDDSRPQRNQEPPSVDEIFKHMDENKDGFLSEKEVKGPLKEMFSKIDTDEDGLLSKKEVKAAPKSKGRRPNRG